MGALYTTRDERRATVRGEGSGGQCEMKPGSVGTLDVSVSSKPKNLYEMGLYKPD